VSSGTSAVLAEVSSSAVHDSFSSIPFHHPLILFDDKTSAVHTALLNSLQTDVFKFLACVVLGHRLRVGCELRSTSYGATDNLLTDMRYQIIQLSGANMHFALRLVNEETSSGLQHVSCSSCRLLGHSSIALGY
jgi:hypothetical protein